MVTHVQTLLLRLSLFAVLAPLAMLSGCGAHTASSPAGTQPGTPGGGSSAAAPTVSSIAPVSVPAGAASFTLTVNGSGFTSASVVQVAGVAETTTYISATQIQANIPAAQVAGAGSLPVVVANGSTSSSSAQTPALQVTPPAPMAPSISSLSPSSVVAGSVSFTLTVDGAGFTNSSVVMVGGTAEATSYISATELQVTIPAAQVASPGSLAIVVSNGSTALSQAVALTVTAPPPAPAPILSSLSPSAVPAGAAAMITLQGSGFEQGSVAQWNGSARATTYASATQLVATLTAADLASAGTGKLTVINPDGSVSAAVSLTINASNSTGVQSVVLQALKQASGCDQIQATLTANNLPQPAQIAVNGVVLPSQFIPFGNQIIFTLPFLSGQHTLTFTVSSPYDTSSPPLVYTYPASAPAVLSVCALPANPVVYPGTGFALTLQAFPINITATPNVTIGGLQNGITLTGASTLSVPDAGAVIQFKASSTVAAGSYSIMLNGAAGSATDVVSVPLTVMPGMPPAFSWQQPSGSNEEAVVIGSSAALQFTLSAGGAADYVVTPAVSGLPAGVTASFSPASIIPGQTTTLTLTAASSAPVSMNTTVTVTGTADAPVAAASTTFLLDVTHAPGSNPDNGTDFTDLGGTPYAAVYDAAHQHIFASNPSWNRVDVLDAQTHKVVHEITIRSPRALDLAPDGTRLWVGTGTRLIYSVDPVTFALTSYELPLQSINSVSDGSFGDSRLFALADSTLLLYISPADSAPSNLIWNPATGALSPVTTNDVQDQSLYPVARSGDGTHAYLEYQDSENCYTAVYSTATAGLSSSPTSTERCGFYAVNQDGSRLVLGASNGYGLYDGSFNLLGALPSMVDDFNAGFYFNPNGAAIYEFADADYGRVIETIDPSNLAIVGSAPALTLNPVFTSGAGKNSSIFALSSSNLLLGMQYYGISFEDPTFFQHYASSQSGQNTPSFLTPAAGPLAGGTADAVFGYFSLTPDVWYGILHGTGSVDGSNTLTITSPPSPAPGPVNLKFLFPDGEQEFTPDSFTYGVAPQYSVLSGASPSGGSPGELSGYGLPADASGGTVTVGGANAPITTQKGQYPAYTGEPFGSTFLNYTLPAGAPGWADLTVETPNGASTLSRAVFYAKSITDYSSSDSFTAVLYDSQRQQVYLSAGDHIDVFSLTSNTFTTPLVPAANGAKRQFAGLALTPDGSELLAADLLDGSLALINPDAPTQTSAIPITPAVTVSAGTSCTYGPLYVAATADGNAFVTTGGLPGPGCPSEGILYQASLQAHTAAAVSSNACRYSAQAFPPPYDFPDAHGVQSNADGTTAIIGSSSYNGSCLYSSASGTYTPTPYQLPYGWGAAISGDGNVIAGYTSFDDATGAGIGGLDNPIPLVGGDSITPTNLPAGALLEPQLDASGSLYYWPFSSFFDIYDVAQGGLRLRFGLTETIADTAQPLAITPYGDQVFLITNKGLTVVDLGTAPLSIGHLSVAAAGPGAQITLRGSGFVSGLTATVGGVSAAVSVTDAATLTLTVPTVTPGAQDIVLTDPDGNTYTLQSGLVVQ